MRSYARLMYETYAGEGAHWWYLTARCRKAWREAARAALITGSPSTTQAVWAHGVGLGGRCRWEDFSVDDRRAWRNAVGAVIGAQEDRQRWWLYGELSLAGILVAAVVGWILWRAGAGALP